jgi:hypothetical protein
MAKPFYEMTDAERRADFEKFMARERFHKSTDPKEGDEEILNKGVTLNKEKKCKFCVQGITGTCSLNSVFCINAKNRPYFQPSGLFQVLKERRLV